ncbi:MULTISPECIES: hypothetical protein [Bacillus]|uniref:hypothetical protein n=1 Tax=Bacillus TaxID=1386 RepID=UPI0007788308|nr:hypothetical protein [Bacillus toyonensis]KXY42476.1 hypothetical protein AT265_09230 [Bacillus cereus]PEE29890.1 hypothetical protein CON98_11950 [Bacillus toyonensis]
MDKLLIFEYIGVQTHFFIVVYYVYGIDTNIIYMKGLFVMDLEYQENEIIDDNADNRENRIDKFIDFYTRQIAYI